MMKMMVECIVRLKIQLTAASISELTGNHTTARPVLPKPPTLAVTAAKQQVQLHDIISQSDI